MTTPKVLVVGSGVIGLRTAVELVRQNVPVVLRAPKHPLTPSETSQGAGGLWMPFHCDGGLVEKWSIQTLDELLPIATKGYEPKAGELVEIVPSVLFHPDSQPFKETFMPKWLQDPRLKCQHLTTEMLWWQNSVYKLKLPREEILLKAGYTHAWLFETPIVNSPKMLEHMLQEVQEHPDSDVNVETNEYYESIDHVLDEARSLGCNKVLNATGLGSKALCDDPDIFPARGVLLNYDRTTCTRQESVHQSEHGEMLNDAAIFAELPPWGTNEHPAYMIPRSDVIVVGGTYLEHDTEPQLRPEEREQLYRNAKNLGVDTDKVQPMKEWTGFRPYRTSTRLEIDSEKSADDIRLVHSYGMGGSGWTVFAGTAKDATDLLLK
eukprot:Nitzschia sp. Nitz4//scaffold364_size14896//8962//10095//NITZ4_008910-RA/size14896-processed-gene-0.10-mRNA-1//1//CDS//3329549276//3993//frame0